MRLRRSATAHTASLRRNRAPPCKRDRRALSRAAFCYSLRASARVRDCRPYTIRLRRSPMPSSVAVPGSGTPPPPVLAQGPFTSVVPAKVFAVSAYTQPLIVPESVPLPPVAADMVKLVPARMFPSKVIGPELSALIVAASVPLPPVAADIVKLVPARMFPSKVIGPELPTLIVAASLTAQKMLLVCAPSSSVNVIAPFTVRAPLIRITKTLLGLSWASNVKLMPVFVEMSPVDKYAVLPMNVWLVVRPANDAAVDA